MASKEFLDLIQTLTIEDISKINNHSEFKRLFLTYLKSYKTNKQFCEVIGLSSKNEQKYFSKWKNGNASLSKENLNKLLNFLQTLNTPKTEVNNIVGGENTVDGGLNLIAFCKNLTTNYDYILNYCAFVFPYPSENPFFEEYSEKSISLDYLKKNKDILYLKTQYKIKEHADITIIVETIDDLKRGKDELYKYCLKTISEDSLPIDISTKSSKKSIEDNICKIYPDQEKIGDVLFTSLKRLISENKFTPKGFDFTIIVPNRLDLYHQTKKRVNMFLKEENIKISSVIPKCSMPSTSKESTKQKKKIYQRALDEPDLLFVIIHDECHWGVKSEGIIDKYFSKIRDLPNVFFVMISATAENTIINFTNSNIINWETIIPNSEYVGFNKLMKNEYSNENHSKIVKCDFIENKLHQKKFKRIDKLLEDNKEKKLWFWLMVDYFNALKQENCSSHTKNIINSLQSNPDCMVVIRMANELQAKNSKEFLDSLLNNIEILIDTFSIPLKIHCIKDSEKKKKITSIFEKQNNNEKLTKNKRIPYSCLQIPCILFIVEKGRMGSTFPPNFMYFDLRTRYSSTPILSSVKQDFGRCNGYNIRPVMILNIKGYEIAKDMHTLDKPDIYTKYIAGTQLTKNKNSESNPFNEISEYYLPKKNMHTKDITSNCLVLQAEPQIGKTGAYLVLIKLLHKEYNIVPIPKKNNLATINFRWYNMNSEELQQYVQNNPEEYENYHKLCCKAAIFRKNIGKKQPFEYAIEKLYNFADEFEMEDDNDIIRIADFGSGPKAPIYNKLIKDQRFEVTSFDLVENKENKVIAANCSKIDKKYFKKFNCVVIVSSLMGSDYGDFLNMARESVKRHGMVILVEFASHLQPVKPLADYMWNNGLKQISNERVANGSIIVITATRINKKDNCDYPQRVISNKGIISNDYSCVNTISDVIEKMHIKIKIKIGKNENIQELNSSELKSYIKHVVGSNFWRFIILEDTHILSKLNNQTILKAAQNKTSLVFIVYVECIAQIGDCWISIIIDTVQKQANLFSSNSENVEYKLLAQDFLCKVLDIIDEAD